MNIKRTLLGAFAYIYQYRKPFSKALLLPVVFLVVIELMPVHESDTGSIFLLRFLSFLIYIVLAISTHRIILLGPQSVSEWGVYMPGKREFTFFMYSIGIGLLMIPFSFLSFIPYMGFLVAGISMAYMMGRLSLILPAIATDREWSFSDSWKATRNHQVLMMVVVGLFPFIISIPELLLSYIPYSGLLVSLLSAITLILVISALSVAFQVIAENPAED